MALIRLGGMRKIHNRWGHKVAWFGRHIAIPYYRLVTQLLAEVNHGQHNGAHEAQQRVSYARHVIEAFSAELEDNNKISVPGPIASAWRSKVLTPILQRQLQGVSDAYAPALDAGVSSDEGGGGDDDDDDSIEGDLTIAAVKKFYLGADQVHPANIPHYVCNLVYNQEMRWHLAVMTGKKSVESEDFFKQTLGNQDFLLEGPDEISLEPDVFQPREQVVLTTEGILHWAPFKDVIKHGVGHYLHPCGSY